MLLGKLGAGVSATPRNFSHFCKQALICLFQQTLPIELTMPPLRRNQRPLFDLIGQIPTGAGPSSGSAPTHTPSAGSMIESTPTSPVSKGKLSSHTPGDEVASFDRYATTARHGGGLNVSINSLYLAGAALVVIAFLVWVGGYFYGMRSKQKELEPALRQSVIPSGGDPLANNTFLLSFCFKKALFSACLGFNSFISIYAILFFRAELFHEVKLRIRN